MPAKIPVEDCDIISPFITEIFNEFKSKADFRNPMKLADITPAHKKEERAIKNDYRPVSILSSISKIFKRIMYNQSYGYIDKYLHTYAVFVKDSALSIA